jgi:hypothetical protein
MLFIVLWRTQNSFMTKIFVATHRLLNADLCYDKHHWRAVENLVMNLRFIENGGILWLCKIKLALFCAVIILNT